MKTLLACLTLALTTEAAAADSQQFVGTSGLLCIRGDFLKTRADTRTKLKCASLCSGNQRCQAFSIADGPCQLFVFDRCSKYVRDCNCTRRAQVFVKRQPGLVLGALCPAGYADDHCGTKYKLFAGVANWNTSKEAIDAEPGLVIFADVTDNAELGHIDSLFDKYGWENFVYLGGRQLRGSVEPAGGWFWVKCNTSVAVNLWNSGEPNNSDGNELITSVGRNFWSLIDDFDYVKWNTYIGALAKCISPFD